VSGPADAFDGASITARGPVSGITVHSHMRSGPHSVCENPLDLLVVIEVSFQLAEKARMAPSEQPPPVTPQSVLERLREMGVRSGNGSRLVGRDAVYESFARLRTKGYFRRITHRADNRVAGVSYEFYEFPAWNPEPPVLQHEDAEFPQVGATSGIAGSGIAGSRSGKQTKPRSPQVKPTSGIAGSGNAGSSASPQVGATSGIAGSPPLPPGGGGGSSPYPLHDDARPHPQPDEEAAFSDEEIAAAVAFLQELPDPWEVGEDDARRIIPKLLAQMRRKEWPAFPETDHKALTACLTANPGGINNHVSILETKRIPNLPAYSRAAGRSRRRDAKPAEGMCARHPNWPEDDCMSCQNEERARRQRPRSKPAPVDGAGLLARLRANQPAE
jgi:hypothetical protein